MHLPFFFDVVCAQVHCLPISYENNVFKTLSLMSLDPILVSSAVSVSGPYTELHEHVYPHCSCFGTTNCRNLLEILTFYCCTKYCSLSISDLQEHASSYCSLL